MTTITLERAFMIRVLEQLDVAQSLLERSQHHAKIAAMYEELRAALSAPATAPEQRMKELEAEVERLRKDAERYRGLAECLMMNLMTMQSWQQRP